MDQKTETDVTHAQEQRARPSPRRVRFWMLIMAVILLVVLGGFYGFEKFRQKAIQDFFAANQPPPLSVAAVKAVTEPVPRYFDGIGTLSAVNQVMVSPQVAGRVVKILFQSGTKVNAGDPLVQLDDGTEQADLATYQAQAKLAEVNLKRATALAKENYGPRANVDQQQSNLDVARAGIARSQVLIDQKLIRAPFGGTLGIRQIDVGEYVGPGVQIVTLTDLDHLHVDFTLPEHSRSSLSIGLPVDIRTDAFPGRSFRAQVTSIEPQIDPQTRAVKLQATMDNPEHLLQPGMFVHARVVLPPQDDAVTLPETAVDYTSYGESVFVIQQDGETQDGKPRYKAVQTFVDVSTRFDGKVAVTKGVKPGDLVINGGQVRVQNGAAVVPTDDNALKTPAETPVE